MNNKEVIDRKGRKFQWDEADGYGWFREMSTNFTKSGLRQQMEQVKNMELRDDDVMICAFPKAGTHWVWEIVSMVVNETTEYERYSKLAAMIEARSPEFLRSLPSPRVLNTHVYVSCLNDQILEKKIKIVHVFRHPKDIAVSFFHHMRNSSFVFDEPPYETFSEFLPYVTGEYGVYLLVSLFRYLNDFEKFAETNSEVVLNLYFEDIKRDPKDAVRKIADFIGKQLTPDKIDDIADKCSFQNMKSAENLKVSPDEVSIFVGKKEREKFSKQGPYSLLRKGEVGDWKTHFTVAENELFERLLEERLKDNIFWKHYSMT